MMTVRRLLLAAALVLAGTVASGEPAPRPDAVTERTVAAPSSTPSPDPVPSAADPVQQPATLDPSTEVGIDGTAFGQDAVEALGDRLPEVAARNGLEESGLRAALEDPSVGVDSTGAIFVAEAPHDEAGQDEPGAADTSDGDAPQVAEAPVVPLDQTFTLHSKPGSQRTVYLDFDGHDVSGTAWNSNHGVADGFQRGWSIDTDFATFNDQERAVIQDAWQRVAEDYAAFDVDVTTQDPGDAAITRSGALDQTYGARALISETSTFPSTCSSTCAGIAYVGVLDLILWHPQHQTAWIKGTVVGSDAKYMAEVISHEIGHNGGLFHAGTTTASYYTGLQNWGPIMGSPYSRAVTQWATDDYPLANRFGQEGDDLTVLAKHGVVRRPDEAPPQPSGAPAFVPGSPTGTISDRTDVDVWAIGRCENGATVTARPADLAPNLDIALSLVDGSGRVLGTADPPSGQTTLRIATGMDATVSIAGAAGTVYARVDGTGRTDVYSDYGSIGPYTLQVQCKSVQFSDVPDNHVFADQIAWMASEGISTGYPDGTFRPADPVLREQMAAFLARFAGVEATLPAPASQEFSDVPVTATFARQISWLSQEGISTGYADGTFRPVQPVLREQMATFLYRRAGSPPASSTCSFTDVPADHPFRAQICWLSSTGISKGYADGSFRPGQPVLREQMAAFLFRYDERGLPR